MKSYKILLLFGFLTFALLNNANAFNSKDDCLKMLTQKQTGKDLQVVFDDYTNITKFSKKLADGSYTLCFDLNALPYEITSSFTITASASAPLLIYGLNINFQLSTLDSSLLTLSGPITLLNSTLTGPGSGTAIQIASGFATIETLTCSNFAQCINVAKDASALVTKGKFTNVGTLIKYEEIPAFAGMTEEWIGKHVNEADATATKVDRIAGKLELTDCKGSVEMYLREKQDKPEEKIYSPTEYHATCTVSELKDDSLELTAADGTKKEIAVGACYFDCDNLTDVLKDNYVSFAYTSAPDLPDLKVGTTSQFNPFPAAKVSDMQDVIWVPLIGESGPGTSNMNGEGSTVYVEQFGTGAGDGTDKIDNEKLFISTTDQTGGAKEQELADEQNNDDPDEPINASSASSLCTLITSANSPQAMPLLIWLMGLPVILLRRFRN